MGGFSTLECSLFHLSENPAVMGFGQRMPGAFASLSARKPFLKVQMSCYVPVCPW